jgi:hypothetical protein
MKRLESRRDHFVPINLLYDCFWTGDHGILCITFHPALLSIVLLADAADSHHMSRSLRSALSIEFIGHWQGRFITSGALLMYALGASKYN